MINFTDGHFTRITISNNKTKNFSNIVTKKVIENKISIYNYN